MTLNVDKVIKMGKITKKKMDKKTGVFSKTPVKTGMPVLKRATSLHCFTQDKFAGAGAGAGAGEGVGAGGRVRERE